MQKVILYIQPQLRTTTTAQDYVRVDLMEEELITLTQVIQDVRDIDKVFTDYSRTFNLPASKTNNKIFKWWYNPDVEGFDNQIMCNARIELNHFAFKDGKIRLEEVVLKKGEPSIYKVTFFGNTLSLTDLIGEDELDNLVWLENFNHDHTDANILTGLQTGFSPTVDSVTYTNAVIYPLISQNQQYSYNSTGFDTLITSGSATTSASNKLTDSNNNFSSVVLIGDLVKNTTDTTYARITGIDDNDTLSISANIMATGENYQIYRTNQGNIANTSSSSDLNYNRHGVFPEDLKPAIKATVIIKAIEEQYGITFKTSEFFDSTEFSTLYLWMQRETTKIDPPYGLTIDNETFTCTPNASYPTSCTEFATFEFATFDKGVFKIEQPAINDGAFFIYEATVTPTTSDIYTVEIVDLLTGFVWSSKTGTGAMDVLYYSIFWDSLEIGDKRHLATRVTAPTGLNFSLSIEVQYDDYFVGNPTRTRYMATYSSTTSPLVAAAPLMRFESNMPKMKIIDFLNSLFRCFNLTAYLNFDNEVVVQTLDNYYAAGDTLDITEYVKTDQNTVGKVVPFNEINFNYPEPTAILGQQYLNNNEQVYGSLKYKRNASEVKKYDVNTLFQHMLYERLTDLSSGSNTEAQYGLAQDLDLNAVMVQPLLFYAIRQTSISDTISFIASNRNEDGSLPDTGTRTTISNYWMPHNANTLGSATTAPTYNLNFGSEINSYTLTDYGGNNNSLFQTYYDNYIVRIFNKKTRIFKYGAILPLKIILQLTLNDKIVIGTRDYTINKMTIKLQSGETSLELLNEPS